MNIHELTHTHTWGRMYTEFSINNVQLLLACEIVVAYFSAPLPTQRVATLLLLCACLCVSVAQIASPKHTHTSSHSQIIAIFAACSASKSQIVFKIDQSLCIAWVTFRLTMHHRPEEDDGSWGPQLDKLNKQTRFLVCQMQLSKQSKVDETKRGSEGVRQLLFKLVTWPQCKPYCN